MSNEPGVIRSWVLVRLALVNAIGYMGTTIVPLWVGGIGDRLHMPDWFGGAVATAQLGMAALVNGLTPFLFRKVPPAQLARRALLCGAMVYPLTLLGEPAIFVLACLAGGACLGAVLNATNRLIAASKEVQKGYSIFLLIEGIFSSSTLYVGGLLSRHAGLISVFLTLPAAALLGAALVISLPAGEISATPDGNRIRQRWVGSGQIPGLLALSAFFCGQSCINTSALTLGAATGISASATTALLAISVIIGLCGAVAARLLGERWGVRAPILVATLCLMLVMSIMTQPDAPTSFRLGILWVQVTTFFIVPYFFTLLAQLDASGRLASIGPAFLLMGAASGPGLAAMVKGLSGPAALGPIAACLLLSSALLTRVATTRHLPIALRELPTQSVLGRDDAL